MLLIKYQNQQDRKLKINHTQQKKYVKKYFRYLKFLENNKDTQWSDYRTDYSTDCSDYADSESESETGADLVIGTKPSVEIKQQTPSNKKTSNKEIPDTN